MRVLDLPVLSGVVIDGWSSYSARAVRKFCRKHRLENVLLRIDKRQQRWTNRRGGYVLPVSSIESIVRELKRDGMIAILLEPASPYADQYSLAGVTIPEQQKLVVEIVGPGFDTSDILRGDLSAHERWEVNLGSIANPPGKIASITAHQTYVMSPKGYADSVEQRLAKIGSRIRNPAFPDLEPKNRTERVREAVSFLRRTRQTTLLRNNASYKPISPKQVIIFAKYVRNLLGGLAGYGIHLGSSSFAASVIPRRGFIFWDFFPARKQDAASLYPGT